MLHLALIALSMLPFAALSSTETGERLPGPGEITNGIRWKLERTSNARMSSSDQAQTRDERPALYLNLSSDEGYAEWRATPMLSVGANSEWIVSAEVEGDVSAPAYISVLGFSDEGDSKPRLLAMASTPLGALEGAHLERKFTIPEGVRLLRVGVGLSKRKGEAWFSELSLKSADNAVSALPKPWLKPLKPDAQWLWIEGHPEVFHVVFSRKLVLPDAPGQAWIQATADNIFKLTINGEEVASGTEWKEVQMIDATRFLKKGENEIIMDVRNIDGAAGMLLAGGAYFANHAPLTFSSDGSWTSARPDGTHYPLAVLGKAPLAPWRTIEIQPVSQRRIVAGRATDVSDKIEAGEAFEAAITLHEEIPLSLINQLKVSFWNAKGERCALSPWQPTIRCHQQKLWISLPTSRFANPDTYHWKLEAPGLAVQWRGQNETVELTRAPLPKPSPARIYTKGGANKVSLNGGEQSPFHYAPGQTTSVENYQAWSRTGGRIFEIAVSSTADYKSDGRWDLFQIESRLLQLLEADPDAVVQLRVRIDAPAWWEQRHPDDCFVSNKGRPAKQSFASAKWRRFAVESIVSLLRELEARPVGRAVAAVLPMGFKGGEFQLWGEEVGEYDCSPVAQAAFERWQERQGLPRERQITLPHPALEFPFPESGAEIRRSFFRFVGEENGTGIAEIVKGIKQEAPDVQVSVYYGYLYEHAASIKRLLYGGSLGFSHVLKQAPLDCITCPASYSLRGDGKGQAFMYPVTSVALNGIQPGVEDDIRNFLSANVSDSSGERLHLPSSSILSLRKLRYLAAAHGASVRYYTAFVDEVDTLQSPILLRELGRVNQEVMTLAPCPIGAAGQVGHVIAPETLVGLAELPDAESLARNTLSLVRDTLSSVGRPIAYLTFEDWEQHRDKWDTIVLSMPGLLGPDQLDVLRREFGELPAMEKTTPYLVLRRDKKALCCADNEALGQLLAVDGDYRPDRHWYIGGNFGILNVGSLFAPQGAQPSNSR